MKIEVCDICQKRVSEYNSIEVSIKDYKGWYVDDHGYIHRDKRKFKGAICEQCLAILRKGNDSTYKAIEVERLGKLGKLMMPTKEPRGPVGPRGVMGDFDIRKHVTHLDPITDAEGDRWIPVLEEDFKELTKIDKE